jgi:predicted aldo/keto reductase-like oxidoreductase
MFSEMNISKRSSHVDFTEKRILGSTGLEVGPLGVAASYGAPSSSFEEAFERGCNYFYWGSMRKKGMGDAIRNLCANGQRDQLILVLQSYSRSAFLMESFVHFGLRKLSLDHADVLLLGWHNKRPAQRILDKALEMKEKGTVRFLGVSGHKRRLFPDLARENMFDLFHIRYNAAHRGAEQEIFPHIGGDGRLGIVSYTATRWGQLCNPRKMPQGEAPLAGSDCYRFVLSHPAVDVCITGPKNSSQMKDALKTLELGPLSEAEMERVRRIGEYVHHHTSGFF